MVGAAVEQWKGLNVITWDAASCYGGGAQLTAWETCSEMESRSSERVPWTRVGRLMVV